MDSKKQRKWIQWMLIIIIVGAIGVRLPFLDLYRFEHEMVRDIHHSERILQGEFLLRGVYGNVDEDSSQQSFGPLMYYMIAGSLLLAPSKYWYPLMPSILVMILNLIAVWLCYRFGKEFFNEFVGLSAAALFAFSPWFVLHVSSYASNPNYLPPFIMAFVYFLAKVIVKREDKFLLPSFIALALATQLHLSSLMLFPFLLATLLMWRRDLFKKKVFYKAIGITALLYIPYVLYIIKTNSWSSLFAFAAARYPSAFVTVFMESIGIPILYITPKLTPYLLGNVSVLPKFVNGVTTLMMIGVIVLGIFMIRNRNYEKRELLLLLWLIVPILFYVVIGKNVSPHFFIILLPVQFLILAIALNKISERYKKTTISVIVMIIISYLIFILQFYAVIDENGGTDSLFGVPYKYRVQVIQEIAKETTTPTIIYYGDNKRNMNWLFSHFGITPTYKYVQSLDEFKEGYLIFDEYDFYSYSDKAVSQEEKEKVKNEPGTTIKHIKVLRR
ncbi:MAG TPA: glycosyltransferase family 39 protein [Candidatus Nanoarchaeia archaeon]|nr:glycosyltransferase family 39 protein [Candidatus Nanoarchaeia archaeon]